MSGSIKLCGKADVNRKDHVIANSGSCKSQSSTTKNSSKKGKGKCSSRDDHDQDSSDDFDLPSTSCMLDKGHTKVLCFII